MKMSVYFDSLSITSYAKVSFHKMIKYEIFTSESYLTCIKMLINTQQLKEYFSEYNTATLLYESFDDYDDDYER